MLAGNDLDFTWSNVIEITRLRYIVILAFTLTAYRLATDVGFVSLCQNQEEPSTEETKRDCALECGPDKTCFENTCCSNKFKQNKKNANEPSSRSGSIDVEPPQETNQSFEMVDETTTSRNTEAAPSTEMRTGDAANDVEMGEWSTNI